MEAKEEELVFDLRIPGCQFQFSLNDNNTSLSDYLKLKTKTKTKTPLAPSHISETADIESVRGRNLEILLTATDMAHHHLTGIGLCLVWGAMKTCLEKKSHFRRVEKLAKLCHSFPVNKALQAQEARTREKLISHIRAWVGQQEFLWYLDQFYQAAKFFKMKQFLSILDYYNQSKTI